MADTNISMVDSVFAFRVTSDRMLDPSHSRSTQHGYLARHGYSVVVDRSVAAQSGDEVVVANGVDGRAYGILNIKGDRRYLRSRNPAYRPLHLRGDARVLGVVIGVNVSTLRR
jgi:SOS-response transcriptional repressor LexA